MTEPGVEGVDHKLVEVDVWGAEVVADWVQPGEAGNSGPLQVVDKNGDGMLLSFFSQDLRHPLEQVGLVANLIQVAQMQQ